MLQTSAEQAVGWVPKGPAISRAVLVGPFGTHPTEFVAECAAWQIIATTVEIVARWIDAGLLAPCNNAPCR